MFDSQLGLFILDTFEWHSADGSPETIRREDIVIGGGGTYAIVGARMWCVAGVGRAQR